MATSWVGLGLTALYFALVFRRQRSRVRAVLTWALVGPSWWALAGACLRGQLWATPWLLLTTVVLIPWPICRLALIPLGLVRPAFWLGHLSGWHWGRDARGGGLVAAALAAGRRHNSAGWAWIERQRDAAKTPSVGALLATGLGLAHRGSLELARDVIGSIAQLDPRCCPPSARAMAFEWLAAEAAERGDWASAARWGDDRSAGSASARFIALVGRRLTAGHPGDREMWIAWLRTGRLRALRPLLRQALASMGPFANRTAELFANDRSAVGGSPREHALQLHVRALRTPGKVTHHDLQVLARVWQRALTPAQRRLWAARAQELGARREPHGQVGEMLEQDLVELLRIAGLDLDAIRRSADTPPLLSAAAERLRLSRVDATEVAASALRDRIEAKDELPPVEEWLQWVGLRRLYDDAWASAGIQTRAEVYSVVQTPVCSLACWLHNDRACYVFANALFRWLLAEARLVGDSQAVELHTRNVACAPWVP